MSALQYMMSTVLLVTRGVQEVRGKGGKEEREVEREVEKRGREERERS